MIEIGADGELKSGKICSTCGTVSKFKANYCLNWGASFAEERALPSQRHSCWNETALPRHRALPDQSLSRYDPRRVSQK